MRFSHTTPASKSQGGFAIVSAIFLLVALAVLGAVMVTFSNTQHLTSAQDVQGSRAYWAAKGGIQWAAASIISSGTCTSGTLAFTDGFNVVVDCNVSHVYSEGTSNNTIYWVTSTASAGGGVGTTGYVERQVQAFIQ